MQLAGRANSALSKAPLVSGKYLDIQQPIAIIENIYKKTFQVFNGSVEEIAKVLTKDGDRAIIYEKNANVNGGHVINAVRQNGKINLIDGQIGKGGSLEKFSKTRILKKIKNKLKWI